jgi:hypothetical protein
LPVAVDCKKESSAGWNSPDITTSFTDIRDVKSLSLNQNFVNETSRGATGNHIRDLRELYISSFHWLL